MAFILIYLDGREDSCEPHCGEWFGAFHRPSRVRVCQSWSLFKGYLTSQLEEKGKQFERSAKSDKEAADINKYKGNQKKLR